MRSECSVFAEYAAKQEITMLSWLFGLAFGKFNEEFIEIVAHAFEDKIETQISIEEYTS